MDHRPLAIQIAKEIVPKKERCIAKKAREPDTFLAVYGAVPPAPHQDQCESEARYIGIREYEKESRDEGVQ